MRPLLFTLLFLQTMHCLGGTPKKIHKKALGKKVMNNSKQNIILKSDLLTVFNTVLGEHAYGFNLSSEFCPQTCYSIQINMNYNHDRIKNGYTNSYEPGAEIRWYIESSEIAFLHLGLYSFINYENKNYKIEVAETSYQHRKAIILENGLAGGYRILMGKNIELDILTYLGYVYRNNSLQSGNVDSSWDNNYNSINARVLLCLGYMF